MWSARTRDSPICWALGGAAWHVSPEDLHAYIVYQSGALEAFLRPHGRRLNHIKPHGALYPMLNAQEDLAEAAVEAFFEVMDEPVVYWPAGSEDRALLQACRSRGVRVVREYYPDSKYGADGETVVEHSREPTDPDEAETAFRRFLDAGVVQTVDGGEIPLEAESVCVHGDGPSAVAIVDRVRRVLEETGRAPQAATAGQPEQVAPVIYDEPVFRPLGDMMLGVEFGDEANVALNFKVLGLEIVVREAEIPGVIETIPSLRELVLVLDRSRTTHARAQEAVEGLMDDLQDVTTLPSRKFVLPCWYDDPWSAELAERYEVDNNLKIIAEANGLTKAETIEQHTSTEFWVVCVGFTPGCYFSIPLDMSKLLKAPKWKTPRDYTPARCLALAGFSTGAYPVASPGGYQLLGRLAANIYEAQPRNAIFPEDGVLLRAGDRLQYRDVGALEYDRIWSEVEAGDYDYDVEEDEFDVPAYLAEHQREPSTA